MILHQLENSLSHRSYNAFISSNIALQAHFHNSYELIYALEDGVRLMISGKEEVIHKNELVLVFPCIIHTLDMTKAWVGVFSSDYIAAFDEKKLGIAYAKFKSDRDVSEFLDNNLFYEGVPKHYMLKACLYLVCQMCKDNAEYTYSLSNPSFIQRVTEYISNNISSEMNMEKLAAYLGYEYHYTSKLFHDCFNMNFKKFLNIYRVQYACDMLIHTDKSITEVAYESGFQSLRSFHNFFSKMMDTSPMQYKKASQK